MTPTGVPMPDKPVNLVRQSINGITDKIPDLKTAIAGMDLDEHLKQYLCSELDEITSNAAEVHLHDIERPDGGFNLHLSVKPVQLGVDANSFFARKG
jgi:hypothetical protein